MNGELVGRQGGTRWTSKSVALLIVRLSEYLIPLTECMGGHIWIPDTVSHNSKSSSLSPLSPYTHIKPYINLASNTSGYHSPKRLDSITQPQHLDRISSQPNIITQTACPGWAGSEAVVMTIKNPLGMQSLNWGVNCWCWRREKIIFRNKLTKRRERQKPMLLPIRGVSRTKG